MSALRRNIFWFLERFKSNSIKSHYDEVKFVMRDPFSEKSKGIRDTNLEELIRHAKSNVPFYKKVNSTSITDFPVIKKTLIQENFNEFKAINCKPPFHKVATSGSTGIPFFLYHDVNKRKRNAADVLYFLNEIGHKVGDTLFELEVWRSHNKKSILKSWMQNVYQYDVSKLDYERIDHFFRLLKKSKKSKTLMGFASSFEIIAQYLKTKESKYDALRINAVIATSEYLNSFTKENISKYLNTEVYSRYSNEELGIMAQQTKVDNNLFKLNWASYYFEILEFDNDKPVENGSLGRVVVTDLFNFSMPLIRYDTGDVAQFIEDENGNFGYFQQVEGRKMDLVFDTKGNALSSFVVYTQFYDYYKYLKQYQFIQTGVKSYKIKLNCYNSFQFENELLDKIRSEFGLDANIEIEYVDEIPPLASGKRKKVVNTFYS